MGQAPYQAVGTVKQKPARSVFLDVHALAGIWVLMVSEWGCHSEVPKVPSNRMDSLAWVPCL